MYANHQARLGRHTARTKRHAKRAGRLPLGRLALIAATPIGFGLSALLVWQTSQSAFNATKANGSNTFSDGTVSLTADDSGTAMFTVSGLKPGSTGLKCIAVTYGGSLAAAVKLYVAPSALTGTGAASYLNLTIEEGTTGSFSSCGAFAATSTDYTGTLAGFAGSSTAFASGVGNFNPTGSASTKVYRFTYTLQDVNAAQGLNSAATFTWEAQNT